MITTNKPTVRLRVRSRGLATTLGVAVLTSLTSGGCDTGDSSGSTDGNTSFLAGCETDADCASPFSCMCGICSRACSGAGDCDGLPAAASCGPDTATRCSGGARYCAPSCAGARQCGAGLVCVDDACVPGAVPGAGGAGSGGARPGGAGGEAQGAGGTGSGGARPGGAGGEPQGAGGEPQGAGGSVGSGGTGLADSGVCLEANVLEDAGICTSLVCSTATGVEIRLTRAGGFYVGALFYSLVACNEIFTRSHHPGGVTTTIAFPLSNSELAALPPDAPLLTFYGAMSPGSPLDRSIHCGALSLNLPIPIGACPD